MGLRKGRKGEAEKKQLPAQSGSKMAVPAEKEKSRAGVDGAGDDGMAGRQRRGVSAAEKGGALVIIICSRARIIDYGCRRYVRQPVRIGC